MNFQGSLLILNMLSPDSNDWKKKKIIFFPLELPQHTSVLFKLSTTMILSEQLLSLIKIPFLIPALIINKDSTTALSHFSIICLDYQFLL